ncbi:siderophore-interacting protein [Nocardia speluncae]|uniref:Siderophore-interacting protein n=1 Tax=Nocardia speluncae TaxID=419477 RepID=A0A846XPF4_9NOCA|nr:siderophore-interacting protein [Nocardia speluncae]NKY37175.1 siderophore-interacting protein [Nocardia speluncae]
MGRGGNGVIMKVWRAEDYRLTVTTTERITDKYIRIGFTAGGLLNDHPVHPTQFIRLWIPDAETDKLHHRGYTLIDQDPGNDHFYIEFAVHTGPAGAWAERAQIGEVIETSVLGSNFELPATTPGEYVIFGDSASLPAVNTLLEAIGNTPARVWLEWQYESDPTLPVRNKPHHTVTWLQRVDDGRAIREAAQGLTVARDAFAWVACDAATTRAVVKTLRGTLPKTQIKAQGYWK